MGFRTIWCCNNSNSFNFLSVKGWQTFLDQRTSEIYTDTHSYWFTREVQEAICIRVHRQLSKEKIKPSSDLDQNNQVTSHSVVTKKIFRYMQMIQV